ncbi:hypothetical protein D4Z93_07625 [Clostridium fermenticellae]|uniref:Uncharacterized protein n=1 Tax=Clostridium fermenticellae TaxID=2068654 RepID=A0A386H3U6_9CLOT|nr:DL-endopeptidase inhibitor IseA family protein [Clostridium fermenticellae]AYD40399.1 hypothetical protein D4Z93_07625 [Clostridium fermenticellae]
MKKIVVIGIVLIIVLGGKNIDIVHADIFDRNYDFQNNNIVSNDKIKEILIKSDNAFRKLLKIKVDYKECVNISGKSYARVEENIEKYGSVYNYLVQNNNLKNYYTDEFIDKISKYIFKRIDGKYYMLYGNPEPRVIVKNSNIVSQKIYNNRIYLIIKDYTSNDKVYMYANIQLIFNGDMWIIDKSDNWGIR